MEPEDYDVVVLTEKQYMTDATDELAETVHREDALVLEALRGCGLRATKRAWDDLDCRTRSIVFRSTWDYFDRIEEFQRWLNSLETRCFNDRDLVRWNMDKSVYLRELKGIHIVKTRFIDQGDVISLRKLHEETGWQHTVAKPVVSGNARETRELFRNDLDKHEAWFSNLLKSEGMMLQEFQRHIIDVGEVSLVVINGSYSHAVLKMVRKGDFRVQDNFGGGVSQYDPSPEEIRFAQAVCAACPTPPLYARVDVIRDNDGLLALAELELIEPELFFRHNPQAADRLAQALHNKLLDIAA